MQEIISKDVQALYKHKVYHEKVKTTATRNGFIHWCELQESKRFFWLGVSLLISIGLVLPATLSSIVFLARNEFALWLITCVVNVPVLVLNLAAQPTKITLPALFASWGVNIAVIIYSTMLFLAH